MNYAAMASPGHPDQKLVIGPWGHSDTASALALARDAEVKRFVLYHHDPNRSDENMDEMVAGCREWVERERASFTVEGAIEGEIIL